MDFFSRQESARRATARMLIYFSLTVVLLFLAVNGVLWGCALLAGKADFHTDSWLWHYWTPQALLGTLLLVLGGSLLEWLRLRDGGKAVAEMMGATPVDYATRDLKERQLLNVADEMAIAAGLPVPAVQVMKREAGINAFVAGLSPRESVLVVTQGALDHLDREELQGVVAHEFSHILNGDMRLNLRMLAVLAGMLAVGQLGGFLMRSLIGGYDGRRRRNPVIVVYLFGAGLWLVGAVGLFMGRLIKAAVSREREVLADAAGVQFTRNPEGLAGALWKIRQQGSWLDNLHAEDMSHLCFSPSVRMQQWLATHPPLEERIEAVCPGYLARRRHDRPAAAVPVRPAVPPSPYRQEPGMPALAPAAVLSPETASPARVRFTAPDDPIPVDGFFASNRVADRVGELRIEDLSSAQWLHRQLPVEVTRALQSATGARAVLHALIARFQSLEDGQLESFLDGQGAFAAWVRQLEAPMQGLDARFALPVVELCLPRLGPPDGDAAAGLLAELEKLALLNAHLSVFEFCLLLLVERQVRSVSEPVRRHPLRDLAPSAATALRVLLAHGAHDSHRQQEEWRRLVREFMPECDRMETDGPVRLPDLARALRTLAGLDADGKRAFLALCARAVESDGRLHLPEYELLRVVAALLDCPLPLLQGVIPA